MNPDLSLTKRSNLRLDFGNGSVYYRTEQTLKPATHPLTEFHGLRGKFSTILIDPPWRFINRTGKVAPEHRRLHRYETMSFDEIANLPVPKYANDKVPLPGRAHGNG